MKLRYLIIKVKDIQRAKKFYIQLLGINPEKEELSRMIKFNLGNINVGLYNPLADGLTLNESDFGTNCMASFGAENFADELSRVSKFAEIVSHEKSGHHEWCEFKDSEGNILEIHKI